MKTSVALVLLAACGLGAASLGAAAATPESDVLSLTVRYGDLDLATDQGARVLYRRLTGAANLVCPTANHADLGSSMRAARCRATAIDAAVKKINNAHLAEIAFGHVHTG